MLLLRSAPVARACLTDSCSLWVAPIQIAIGIGLLLGNVSSGPAVFKMGTDQAITACYLCMVCIAWILRPGRPRGTLSLNSDVDSAELAVLPVGPYYRLPGADVLRARDVQAAQDWRGPYGPACAHDHRGASLSYLALTCPSASNVQTSYILQVLQGIRLIKYYDWEGFYAHQISTFREKEVSRIRRLG